MRNLHDDTLFLIWTWIIEWKEEEEDSTGPDIAITKEEGQDGEIILYVTNIFFSGPTTECEFLSLENPKVLITAFDREAIVGGNVQDCLNFPNEGENVLFEILDVNEFHPETTNSTYIQTYPKEVCTHTVDYILYIKKILNLFMTV